MLNGVLVELYPAVMELVPGNPDRFPNPKYGQRCPIYGVHCAPCLSESGNQAGPSLKVEASMVLLHHLCTVLTVTDLRIPSYL